jgi:hypothetical protein
MVDTAALIKSRTIRWTMVSQSEQRAVWGWLFQPR